MNRAILIGRTTADVELKQTQSGTAFCTFTLAVDRKFKTPDGDKQTDFFNIVAWRGLAETCAKYLTKGKQCCIEGEIQNRSYEDRNGGKRYITEIIADTVEFIGSSGNREQAPMPDEPPQRQVRQVSIDSLQEIPDEDLPF